MMLIALAIAQAVFAVGSLQVINGHIRDRHVNAAWGAIVACLVFAVTAYALWMEAMQ